MFNTDSIFNEGMDEENQKLENLFKQFDVNMMKFQSYTESTNRQYNLELQQAELRCMKENGTMDDFMYLESAAKEGALSKFKKILNTLIAMWKKFVDKLKDSIKVAFSKKSTESFCKSVEDAINKNAFIGKRKINVPDYESIVKIINRYRKDLDSVSTKVVVGVLGNKTPRYSILEMKEQFDAEIGKKTAIKTAIKSISILSGLAILRTQSQALPSYLDQAYKTNGTILQRLRDSLNDDEAVVTVGHAVNSCAEFYSHLAKQDLHQRLDWLHNIKSAIKETLSAINNTLKGTPPNTVEQVMPIVDSASDDYDQMNANEIFEDVGEEYDDLNLDLDW